MSDFTLVDPRGWEYDLHSVYSAYIGYFQQHNIPWYERSWGHLFSTFEEFLAFSWPAITVTDAWTGRAHIVTRLNSIGAFLKMIKTRFGETLPQAPNMLQVTPFETNSRHLRTVSDYASYKKMHSTLPAAVLSALKQRVRAGEPKAIRDLWASRDRTFLAISFEWSERNEKSCLEWGYAAVRCGHLEACALFHSGLSLALTLDRQGYWPPIPESNYRKGHYIVSEYVDKVVNRHSPTFPWQVLCRESDQGDCFNCWLTRPPKFGDSQMCQKSRLPQIIQAVISSLASPDSETLPNTLVLVAHGINGDLAHLEEMKIRLPHNMLIIDTANFERSLFSAGHRPPMIDPHTSAPGNPKPRGQGSVLSLDNLLRSLPAPGTTDSGVLQTNVVVPGQFPQLGAMIPGVVLHNSGNDAFMCLYALQLLLQPQDTSAPIPKQPATRPNPYGMQPSMPIPMPMSMSMTLPMTHMAMMGSGLGVPGMVNDFGQLSVNTRQGSRSPRPIASTLGVPQSPSKYGNGAASMGRNSKRASALPKG
ncbi:unnamed protein product [Mycena citricolor]|uniref:Gfd2/YDR514C-like C-terminal domain-containing protein n=1 Tax=Mycena citricolor TaxID=2018698 RepID=A0AAD2K4G3_9AGAR|nr:unnamed protein product [Mycena citricolor]